MFIETAVEEGRLEDSAHFFNGEVESIKNIVALGDIIAVDSHHLDIVFNFAKIRFVRDLEQTICLQIDDGVIETLKDSFHLWEVVSLTVSPVYDLGILVDILRVVFQNDRVEETLSCSDEGSVPLDGDLHPNSSEGCEGDGKDDLRPAIGIAEIPNSTSLTEVGGLVAKEVVGTAVWGIVLRLVYLH